jgi:acetyltransferase-like isoleucine patch superfamily enzyme
MKIVPIYLRRILHEYKLKCRFTKSVIHSGVTIDKSSVIGDWSVLFKKVSLINSSLGNYSYVQENTLLNNTDVGPFCSIASNVSIGLLDHPTFMVSTSPVFYDNSQPLPKFFVNKIKLKQVIPRTLIGADVWIGEGVRIKAGVNIGVGAVIGAGSLITKDVLPYTIAAGIPCRIIRPRFNIDIVDRLLKSEWWNFNEKKLNELSYFFSDPVAFLNEIEKNNG